jgi:uncharacterized Rossmann fold enzyme
MAKIKFTLGYTPEDEENTLEVRLALQPSEDEGAVDLVALDHDGDVEQYVMTFKNDGTYFRHSHGNYVTSTETDENPHNFLVETIGDDE